MRIDARTSESGEERTETLRVLTSCHVRSSGKSTCRVANHGVVGVVTVTVTSVIITVIAGTVTVWVTVTVSL